jgi:threonine synthase
LIDELPALGLIQSAGCAPMAQAWQQGLEQAPPIKEPTTYISTLSTGDPGRSYQLLRQRMNAGGGGTMESVTDEEAFSAMHMLAKMEGLSVEPAAAVAFAGVIKLARAGALDANEVIVVNCSGHTQPVEEELLGEYWATEIELQTDPPALQAPSDGLLSALTHLDQDRTSEVLIVDDHADARRLIRRILQAQGDFTIKEAETAAEGLALCRQDSPDLIILDLMMPEMDGFEMVEALRKQPETSLTPVIVVTAKELTLRERNQLQGQISKLMMKGDFLNQDLLDEIGRVLE